MAGEAWEPLLTGSEGTQLTGALERLRTTFRWKVDGLDAARFAERAVASSLTLRGCSSPALVEDHQFGEVYDGAPWSAADWDAAPRTPACGAWSLT